MAERDAWWADPIHARALESASQCDNASASDSPPPTVAYCIGGSTRSFATPLVLALLRSNLFAALGGSNASRVFLQLKVGDSDKLEMSGSSTFRQHNESTAAIIRSGRNPTMRHMSRTQGVNVQWLHDLYKKKTFGVVYTRTEAQCADIFTKTFCELPKWQQAVRLIAIGRPEGKLDLPPEPGPRPETLEKKRVANQSLASDDAE